jgi:hypothetical protein
MSLHSDLRAYLEFIQFTLQNAFVKKVDRESRYLMTYRTASGRVDYVVEKW